MIKRTATMRRLGVSLCLTLILGLAWMPAPASATGHTNVLLIQGDDGSQLAADIAAQPGIGSVDVVSGSNTTPSVATMNLYEVVVVYTNEPLSNGVALGNNLADYVDAGGVVVGLAFYNYFSSPYAVEGRFRSGGYSPLTAGGVEFSNGSLGAFDSTHPLMQGVSALTTPFRVAGAAVSPGATRVASWGDSIVAVAVKGRVVGINGYAGSYGAWSGHYGRIVANAAGLSAPSGPSGGETIYHRLSVDKIGPGDGVVSGGQIDCGTVCDAMLAQSTLVTLTADPDDSSIFLGWSGACEGTEPTCTVHMNGARNVVAEFGRRTHSVIVSKAGEGSGTVTGTGIACGEDCAEDFEPGATVTLTAKPAAGSDFAGWSGACTGTGTCVLSVDGAKDVVATFVPQPPQDQVIPSRISGSYAGGVFSGEVSVETDDLATAASCVSDRSVVIRKVRPGKDRVVASAQTDANGEWSTDKAGYRAGAYYAKVRRRVIDNDNGAQTTCSPDRSRRMRIG